MDNTKWPYPSFLWIVLIVCGSLAFIYNVVEIQTYSLNPALLLQPKPKSPVFNEEAHLKGYLIKTTGCTIPDMNPMDSSIQEYIFREDEVVCNNGTPALVTANATSIYVIPSSLTAYKINDSSLLSCCQQGFHRVDPKKTQSDTEIAFDKKCVSFNGSTKISKEFIRVVCKYKRSEIYKDFFHSVPLKEVKTKASPPDPVKLNVLVVGVDAVSRLNLQRQMPLTVSYLQKLKTVQMLGYNKVGDNTFPNLIPVLCGLTESELTNECWPTDRSYFDECPFIWKKFAEAGYTTAYGEDSAWMGLFYYTRKGFLHQPTDYFWNHFDYTAERQIGNEHRLNVHQCIGARSVHKVFLDYISRFSRKMHENSRKFFAFFWGASLSHDFLNKPKLGDGDYEQILRELNTTGILNDTALIFMSDHGIRWGDIRTTYQGMMEERLPFLFIGLPDWYMKQHEILMSNLKTNTRRLTTPFDLHETIKDLLISNELSDAFIGERASNWTEKRGYSLFDKIEPNRTCESAGIDSHWCTCLDSKEISADDEQAFEAANFTINEHINEQLIGYADCAVLELDKVLHVRLQESKDAQEKSYYSEDYTITFRTTPGGGIFEATVRRYITPESYHFNVTGTVSRINLYGKQSLCITDFHLKLYCYCKGYVPED